MFYFFEFPMIIEQKHITKAGWFVHFLFSPMLAPLKTMRQTKEEVKLSRFAKNIQFLSNIYILRISVNYAKSKLTFSYFNLKTLIYILINSVPFLIAILWIFSQPDFYGDFLEALKTVYLKSDLLTMIIFPGTQAT